MKRTITACIATAVLLVGGIVTANSATAASGYATCWTKNVAVRAEGTGTLFVKIGNSQNQLQTATSRRLTGYSSTPASYWTATVTRGITSTFCA